MLNETLAPFLESEASNLTGAEQRILGTLSLFSGSLSFVSSTMIIYLILRNNNKNPYKRILLGLSISDMIASITFATGPFFLPAATSNRVWAMGTDATCSFSGFLSQLSFLELWYNGFLSFYYLATVRFGVSSTNFARKYEPWIHVSTVVFNLGTALFGLLFGIYGELPLGTSCWIETEFPEGCSLDDSCTGETIAWGIAGIWGVFFFLAIIINNLIIYRFVHTTLARTMRSTLSEPSAHEKRLKAVAIQGFLYVGSFLLTYSWGFAIRLMEFNSTDDSNYFWLVALNAFFLPSQGCMNIAIYHVRPEFQQFRKEFPEKGMFWILFQILRGRRITSRLGSANFDVDKSRRSGTSLGRPGPSRTSVSTSRAGADHGSSRRLDLVHQMNSSLSRGPVSGAEDLGQTFEGEVGNGDEEVGSTSHSMHQHQVTGQPSALRPVPQDSFSENGEGYVQGEADAKPAADTWKENPSS